jgi:hypothetical protein
MSSLTTPSAPKVLNVHSVSSECDLRVPTGVLRGYLAHDKDCFSRHLRHATVARALPRNGISQRQSLSQQQPDSNSSQFITACTLHVL